MDGQICLKKTTTLKQAFKLSLSRTFWILPELLACWLAFILCSQFILAKQPSSSCIALSCEHRGKKTTSQDKKKTVMTTEIARQKVNLGACLKKSGGIASSRSFITDSSAGRFDLFFCVFSCIASHLNELWARTNKCCFFFYFTQSLIWSGGKMWHLKETQRRSWC